MNRVIFSLKGGVGKSSITCNLAAISAQQGHKTVVIDLDSQGSASHYLGYQPNNFDPIKDTIADVFTQRGGWFTPMRSAIEFVRESSIPNLYYIPSSHCLDELALDLERRNKKRKLKEVFAQLSEHFDRIYVDTAPSMNFYTQAALIGADRVLVPFDCDAFSLHGLDAVLTNVATVQRDHNATLQFDGVIVNQFTGQAKHPSYLIDQLISRSIPVFDAYLPTSIKMKESHYQQKPIVEAFPHHVLTKAFESLYQEVERK